MGESAKALLGGSIFLSLFGVFIVWFIPDMPSTPIVWALRIGLPIVSVLAGVRLYRAKTRKDVAPDFLREFIGVPFERDGLCFSIFSGANKGLAYLNFVYQNQYASPCYVRIVVSPPRTRLGLGKPLFPGVVLELYCEGGVFGVARAPIGVPAQYQGNYFTFEVTAVTDYPDGSGALLRFRNGKRVGRAEKSPLAPVAVTAGLLAVGVIHHQKPASVTLALPSNVAEVAPQQEPIAYAMWQPGDPVENVKATLEQTLAADWPSTDQGEAGVVEDQPGSSALPE